MNMKDNKKEVTFYLLIVVILLTISILNNVYWKIGKKDNKQANIEDNKEVQLLEINNITYNVPYDERWLD